MGQTKQLLPWGSGTVIQAVVSHLLQAGADPVVVVTGHRASEVEAVLADTPARLVHNPDHGHTEMLRSYQVGVQALVSIPKRVGTLLALGDQPHVPASTIRRILARAREVPDRVVVPSHGMRRGHPIYLPRELWPELLALGVEATLRDLLRRHAHRIEHVVVDTEAVLLDMDRWAEYERLRSRALENCSLVSQDKEAG